MAKVCSFVKRMIHDYFELSAQNYMYGTTGSAWVSPDGVVAKA